MKLSEHGKEQLQAFGFLYNCDGVFGLLDDYEFTQNDFKDCVVLTVEEAKEFLLAFEELIELHKEDYIKVSDFGFAIFDLVKKRIEQAEGKR